MPKTAETEVDVIAEAERLAPDAIQSITKDHLAITRRRHRILDRADTRYKATVVDRQERADSLLRRHGIDGLSGELRAKLTEAASRKAELVGVNSDIGQDARVIAQREKAITRKLEAVRREHGDHVALGVQVAALARWAGDLGLTSADVKNLLSAAD